MHYGQIRRSVWQGRGVEKMTINSSEKKSAQLSYLYDKFIELFKGKAKEPVRTGDAAASALDFLNEARELPIVSPLSLNIADKLYRNYKEQCTRQVFLAVTLLCHYLNENHICLLLDTKSQAENLFNYLYKDDESNPLDPCEKTSLVDKLEEVLDECFDCKTLLETSPSIISCTTENTPLVCLKAPSDLKDDCSRLYLRSFYNYERNIAAFIKAKGQMDDFINVKNKDLAKELLDAFFPEDNSGEVNHQKVAVASALLTGFAVITGGPGTGKTTTIAKLLTVLTALSEKEEPVIMLCAPTGKASSRMVESVKGKIADAIKSVESVLPKNTVAKLKSSIPNEAKTVHKLLKIVPHRETPIYNKNNNLRCDVLVIDEVSMLSVSMVSKLIDALEADTRVIMLGDKDQLSSVESGNVFADVCSSLKHKPNTASQKFKTIMELSGYGEDKLIQKFDDSYVLSECAAVLTKCYRYDDKSLLGKLAKAVNTQSDINGLYKAQPFVMAEGEQGTKYSKITFDSDPVLYCIDDKLTSAKKLAPLAKELCQSAFSWLNAEGEYFDYLKKKSFIVDYSDANLIFDLMNHYRLLCANRNGSFGVNALNGYMKDQIINSCAKNELKSVFADYKDSDCYPGMFIMITKNDPLLNIYNGDIGFAAFSKQDGNALKAFFPSSQKGGAPIVISPEKIQEYESGFAMTIHKSQGSEYQHVCVVLGAKDNPVMTKELLYTGITRANNEELPEARAKTIKTEDHQAKVVIVSSKAVLEATLNRKTIRDSGLRVMLA